ncbi:MAG TPA: hypothetical protein PLB41_13765 [Rubrivivax sp.]|nr:hypothetical protein [Rubrivivax sp.]HPO18642.1 hypothetical protein [Rubrivivax sp.]
MRRPFAWLSGAVAAVLAAAALVFALAIEPEPRVPQRDEVSTADIDRAVALVKLHDPRRLPYGQLRVLTLGERDVDLLVRHAVRRWLGAPTRVQLTAGRLRLQASVALPWGRWLNVDLALRQTDTLPVVDRLRVGRLPLPPALALPLLRELAARHGVRTDTLLELRALERVTLTPGQMALSYRIEPDTTKRLRSALVTPEGQQRLRAYQERLAELTQGMSGGAAPLAQLMPPLFALAAQRGAADGNALAENRAALRVLTLYANDRPLGLLLPDAYDWPRPRPMSVTLRQREDLALHFLISAVISAEAGSPLADTVGLWKELSDARQGGSGFSFDDLAADRAGTRLGERAVRDPAALQARLAAGLTDADLLPPIGDLPTQLSEKQFARRFGAVGSAAYNRVLADIEARIDALPLLQ